MVVGLWKEFSFGLNLESFPFFTHGQDQHFVSCFSLRSAHTGCDITGDRHLQSIWYLFDAHLLQLGGNQEPGSKVLTSSHLQLPKELQFLLNHFC